MRDGVNLAANIHLPEGDGPFPVLMNRTPYGKDSPFRASIRSMIKTFVKNGYACVHVDVRGRGNSDGEFNPNFQEIEDGFDCLEWAGTQPWSNGKVGTFGRSYEGWVQLYPMRLGSKYHKAAFLMASPSMHPFHEGSYSAGVPSPMVGMWALYTSGRTLKDQIYDPDFFDWDKSLKTRPLKDMMRNLGLPYSHQVEHFKHETLDDYFRRLWPSDEILLKTNVPCYFVSGWFDDDLKGTLDQFPAFSQKNPDEKVKRSQKLLIGPWSHQLSLPFGNSSKLGDFDYGAESIVSLDKEGLRWFNYWLKGVENGIMGEPSVRLFLMGANKWIETNSFPVSAAKERSLFLSADRSSNTLYGEGKLRDNHGRLDRSTFTYNPENPAPTPFWKEYFQNGTNEDLRYIQRRDDVLVFTSDKLDNPLNIVGLLRADLFVSTSAVDTDFVARVSDVGPDGYAERLNAGIMRLRYREGYDKIKLVEPGEITEIQIDMWATGQQIQPDHSIRLEITSSGFPTWAPNFNTGESAWEETLPVVANQTVYHSQGFPSKLVFSELPNPIFVEG